VTWVRGKARAIAINTSFRLAPWADVLYACDDSWWLHYFAEVATHFKGSQMWTIAARARDQFKLNWIYGRSQAGGLSRDDTYINAGLNSGHQAVALAYYFGAKKIILLGYDMQRHGGRTHWHPDHPRGKMGNGGRFAEWRKQLDELHSDLTAEGVEVINCSRKTALVSYPRASIQEALP
jgi:hypothetical protein